jgi:hypothetical protein
MNDNNNKEKTEYEVVMNSGKVNKITFPENMEMQSFSNTMPTQILNENMNFEETYQYLEAIDQPKSSSFLDNGGILIVLSVLLVIIHRSRKKVQ